MEPSPSISSCNLGVSFYSYYVQHHETTSLTTTGGEIYFYAWIPSRLPMFCKIRVLFYCNTCKGYIWSKPGIRISNISNAKASCMPAVTVVSTCLNCLSIIRCNCIIWIQIWQYVSTSRITVCTFHLNDYTSITLASLFGVILTGDWASIFCVFFQNKVIITLILVFVITYVEIDFSFRCWINR